MLAESSTNKTCGFSGWTLNFKFIDGLIVYTNSEDFIKKKFSGSVFNFTHLKSFHKNIQIFQVCFHIHVLDHICLTPGQTSVEGSDFKTS